MYKKSGNHAHASSGTNKKPEKKCGPKEHGYTNMAQKEWDGCSSFSKNTSQPKNCRENNYTMNIFIIYTLEK